MKSAVSVIVVAATLVLAWFLAGAWIRRRWPATIPEELGFTKGIETALSLRDVAAQLADRFKAFNGNNVACLGPVRGNAGRVLFHAGPQNKRGNIWRPDYLLQVVRDDTSHVRLRLALNHPYSYVRLNRAEVEALRERLVSAFGQLEQL